MSCCLLHDFPFYHYSPFYKFPWQISFLHPTRHFFLNYFLNLDTQWRVTSFSNPSGQILSVVKRSGSRPNICLTCFFMTVTRCVRFLCSGPKGDEVLWNTSEICPSIHPSILLSALHLSRMPCYSNSHFITRRNKSSKDRTWSVVPNALLEVIS